MGLCTSWFQISTLTRTTLNSGSVRVERSEGNVNKPSIGVVVVEFGKKKKACSQQEVWVSCRGERVLVLCSHVKHLKQRRHKAESSARKQQQQQHPALSVSPRNLIIIIIKPDFSVGPEGITRSHKSCSLSGIRSLLFFLANEIFWSQLKKSLRHVSSEQKVFWNNFDRRLKLSDRKFISNSFDKLLRKVII